MNAQIHNPANVAFGQVPHGWRLLFAHEIKQRRSSTSAIQMLISNTGGKAEWSDHVFGTPAEYNGSDTRRTYITRLSTEALNELP